ncbi:hypothetical protein V1503_24730 [Bacillus sp. SCS-151]|uniref:hypothetical protein n=1 Tax=Nanhaiella sioensis TaxID=3115293 RepID=UPI003979DCE7
MNEDANKAKGEFFDKAKIVEQRVLEFEKSMHELITTKELFIKNFRTEVKTVRFLFSFL